MDKLLRIAPRASAPGEILLSAAPGGLMQEQAESAGAAPVRRKGWKRLSLAFAVAAASDALAWAVALAPPLEWALDLATALALFVILGRRWAILPGLVAEAIPGLAVFPAWIFVVGSIFVYDDVRGRGI